MPNCTNYLNRQKVFDLHRVRVIGSKQAMLALPYQPSHPPAEFLHVSELSPKCDDNCREENTKNKKCHLQQNESTPPPPPPSPRPRLIFCVGISCGMFDKKGWQHYAPAVLGAAHPDPPVKQLARCFSDRWNKGEPREWRLCSVRAEGACV